MKLKWLCVLIVVALVCSNVMANSSNNEDDSEECLEVYLKQKGKLGDDFPVRQSTSTCNLVTIFTITIMEGIVENSIKEEISNNNTECLIREFKNKETLDLLVKLDVIGDSKLSESKIKTETNVTRNELRQDLSKIALQCETDADSFLSIFNSYFGIKNVTLAAMEHNYCFANYAADNELLPLKNVDLNPNGIVTTHINCNAIIRKERRQEESRVRERTKEKKRKIKTCVMDAYRNNNIFDYYIMSQVLEYLEFSKEVKDEQTNQIGEKIAEYSLTLFMCFLM